MDHPPTIPMDKSNVEGMLRDRSPTSSEGATLRIRLRHFTWAQFAFPLSTGGISLLLAATPHRFPGLDTIGKIFFVFDLVVFVGAIVLISLRFAVHRGTLRESLAHPTEALFLPTMLISCMSQGIAGSVSSGLT